MIVAMGSGTPTFAGIATILLVLLLLTALGCNRQAAPVNPSSGAPSLKTLFVECPDNEKARHVLSPVSFSEGDRWRAYVDVEATDSQCLRTTWLWVARANTPYRLVYFMPPKREAGGNGMEILGWAKDSRLLLVKTLQWQWGSDAFPTEQVLAIDAGTGVVYEPALAEMLDARKDKQCWFSVMDAGFRADPNVDILVRAKFFTVIDLGGTEEDVPPAKRCANTEETWSFHFATGEIRQVAGTEPLQIYRKYLPK